MSTDASFAPLWGDPSIVTPKSLAISISFRDCQNCLFAQSTKAMPTLRILSKDILVSMFPCSPRADTRSRSQDSSSWVV
jgi:hypothetical protein